MIVVGAIGFVGLAATAFLRNPDPVRVAGATSPPRRER